MSNLQPIRADLWQTLINTRNVRADVSPESQGYSVLPDEAEELRKGRIPAHWKKPITTAEVARNDVPSSDDEVPFKKHSPWSSKDKTRMVRMRAAKVHFQLIAKKLGRTKNACQCVYYKIKDEPEYSQILKAGTAVEMDEDSDSNDGESSDGEEDEEEADEGEKNEEEEEEIEPDERDCDCKQCTGERDGTCGIEEGNSATLESQLQK
ncbi:hypothetical protein N0V82_005096 [Gnomoniopsis sp. IMI 355080]|nr:hypothetical protein N0V82_005096 [Gnomoniopsis sp. IMI 355080]